MKNKAIIKYSLIIGIILIMLIVGIVINQKDQEIVNNDELVYEIVVEIKGEVKNPAIYTMPENTRISDLVSIAGGFTSYADTLNINLATKLEDGMIIIINKNENLDARVNINKASLEELMTLDGIGEAKAKAIIEYRNANGLFKTIEEIKNVPGITDKIFKNIKDKITI